jgi:DMSO/TMAO reductase YedYZ molybdopterin-dependent catalytic subunit
MLPYVTVWKANAVDLPPGQQRIEGFPRFGAGIGVPPPAVPANPVITVSGAVAEPFDVPVAALMDLTRRELVADFHCVTGWTATGLHWEGVTFADLYRTLLEPAIATGAAVSHVVFRGRDGVEASVQIDDALSDRFLIADRLDGEALSAEHGAPARVVSPDQYGYISIKHLTAIELRDGEPRDLHRRRSSMWLAMLLLQPHPRARAGLEERHRYVPSWLLRRVYRMAIGPIARANARPRDDA